MDRIDAMRLFVRVADTGNFSKVARSMEISQPTVSKMIAALEARLGAHLLRRTSRGLSLTPAGQDFYEAAVTIIAQVEDAETRAGQGDAAASGLVRVTLSAGFARLCIMPHLPRFHALHPGILLDFDVTQRHVNLVEDGLDLAIRIGALSDSSLMARRIGSSEFITAAAPAYLARKGRPDTPQDLADHDCIGFMFRDAPRPWSFKGGVEHYPRGPARSNDAETIRAAVLSGMGIGHNAGWLYAADVAEGRLVRLLEDQIPEPFPIHAVWSGSRRLPGKTRVFIDFLAELFESDPQLRIR